MEGRQPLALQGLIHRHLAVPVTILTGKSATNPKHGIPGPGGPRGDMGRNRTCDNGLWRIPYHDHHTPVDITSFSNRHGGAGVPTRARTRAHAHTHHTHTHMHTHTLARTRTHTNTDTPTHDNNKDMDGMCQDTLKNVKFYAPMGCLRCSVAALPEQLDY